MTTILSVESAAASCSVALNIDGHIIQLFDESPRQHARKLLKMIDQILVDAQLSLKAIDGLAYGCGPGSFTGLRIGFGVIQGLAFGADMPVYGVSTLKVMAYKAGLAFSKPQAVVVPAFDARMAEVYMGVYQLNDGMPSTIVADCALSPNSVRSLLPPTVDIAVGDGWRVLHDDMTPVPHCDIVDTGFFPDAKSVAALALPAWRNKNFMAIDDADISYIRNEVSWKKWQKTRTISGE